MFGFPGGGWPRVGLAVPLVIPLAMVILLMTPAWLVWPFLSDARRQDVRSVISLFVDSIKVVAGGIQSPSGQLDSPGGHLSASGRK